MANKRIPDDNIQNDFINGQILYAEDLNQIINVLKEGINANKLDLDKLLSGNSDSIVAYSLEALNEMSGTSDQIAFLYNPEVLGDGIKVYKYLLESSVWEYQHDLNLKLIYDVAHELADTVKKQYIQEEEPEEWATNSESHINELWFDISG